MRIQEVCMPGNRRTPFLRIIIKCDLMAAVGSSSVFESDWITDETRDLRLDCSLPSSAASSNR